MTFCCQAVILALGIVEAYQYPLLGGGFMLLGLYSPMSHRKGVYFYGHERADVVEERKVFLERLADLETSFIPPPLPEYELSVHDEMIEALRDQKVSESGPPTGTLVANHDQNLMWGEADSQVIRPKIRGSGVMVSDFICEEHGYLRLNEEEFEAAKEFDEDFPQTYVHCWSTARTVTVTGPMTNSRTISKML
jgi:hypothetical protein